MLLAAQELGPSRKQARLSAAQGPAADTVDADADDAEADAEAQDADAADCVMQQEEQPQPCQPAVLFSSVSGAVREFHSMLGGR